MKGSDASSDRRYKTPESRSLDRDRAVQMRSADKRFKKRFKSPPLILDLTVRMIPARFNLDRYNGLICARVLILIRGPRSRDQRVRSTRAVDPTPIVAPRHLQGKKGVGISPTRRKRKENVGYIIPDI